MKKNIAALIILSVCIAAFPAGIHAAHAQSAEPSLQGSQSTPVSGSLELDEANGSNPGLDAAKSSNMPFTFSAAKAAVPMHAIDIQSLDKYVLIEDASDVIHLVYTKYGAKTLYHRCLDVDGAWSADQIIAQDPSEYTTLLSPDGGLCVLWVESVLYDTPQVSGFADILHVEYYRDGSFVKGPDLDYGKGGKTASINGIAAAFIDANGTPQCLFWSNELGGYCLGGLALTKRVQKADGLHDIPVVKGLDRWGVFMADSQGICHMFNAAGEKDTANQTLTHSYSKDMGATWEGPYTVLGNLSNFSIACKSDAYGNIQLLINIAAAGMSTEPLVALCTLKAGTFETTSCQTYLSGKNAYDVAYSKPNGNPKFTSFIFSAYYTWRQDPDGSTHLVGVVGSNHYAVSLKKDGTWDIRLLDTPDISIRGVFMRNNGSLFVVGSDSEIGTDGILLYHYGEFEW